MEMHHIDVGFGGGSLLQVANRTPEQMMTYVIDTPEGKTIVIDGGRGNREDAMHLYDLIQQRGGRVDLWLFTHGHDDHYGALLWLMQNLEHFDIEIAEMRFSFPPYEWFGVVEGGWHYNLVGAFLSGLEKHNIHPLPLERGAVLQCGGISIEVLNDCSNYRNYKSINDSSIVMLFHFPRRDVLFLGDLAVEGSKDLLKVCDPAKLRCDIVQLAHHGQNGVDKAFYEIVRPKICLYTAPISQWYNDNGGGPNSGKWQTLITRKWMEELGAEMSCVAGFGDYLLE